MSEYPPDAIPLEEPLKGMELIFRCAALHELKSLLRRFLARRALVCISPNRKERCDSPATGIFWQDASEWYPCCDAHWPSGSQWLGHTRFYGYVTKIHLFASRVEPSDLQEATKSEVYDREEAT